MSDPIADFLTRIRNAQMAQLPTVSCPSSKIKEAISQVLQDEGYIASFSVQDEEGKPTLNVELKYLRSWLFSNRFEILSNTGFQAGTSFNNLYTGTTVRTGKILVFDHSALTGSRLNKNSTLQAGSQYNDNEWFLFLGFNYTFVLHNSLIEGGLLDPLKSKHTEDAESFFATMKAGIAFSTPIHTCKVTTHWLSPEVVGGKSHNYASIDISVRF